MKKFISILLVCMLVLSLTACGGSPAANAPAATEAPASADAPADAQLAEELKALTESANELAKLYNELVPVAQENGWESDELFVKEANATNAMIKVAGEVVKDPAMLEGKSAQDMIDAINEMATEWDTNMREKVSQPYEAAQ